MKEIRRIAATTIAVAAAVVTPGALADPVALKDVCKEGGYYVVFDAGGNGFADQGQCVSYANRGGRLFQINEQGFTVEIDGVSVGG